MGAGPDMTAVESAVTVGRGLAFVLACAMCAGVTLLWRRKLLSRSSQIAVSALAVHALCYTAFVLFWVDFGLGTALPASTVALWTSILRVHWETTVVSFIFVAVISKGRAL